MLFQKKSVVIAVLFALVTTTTVLLTALGTGYYIYERNRELSLLQDNLEITTKQLASDLALPVWNFDEAVINKDLEGIFHDHDIYGVVAKTNHVVKIRLRDDKWGISSAEKEFSGDGLLVKEQEIASSNKSLGSVKVFASPKFIQEDLKRTLFFIISIILMVDLILVLSISFLFWRIILNPLRVIERYADSFITGKEEVLAKSDIFRGELESLRSSIQSMVGLLASRYIELQEETRRFKESEEQYRMLVENINAGVFQSTLTGTFLKMNHMVAHIAGYDNVDELMSKPASCLYADPDDRRRLIETLMQQGEIRNMELLCMKKDGTQIWISMNAVIQKDTDGGQDKILGVVNDISERKKAENEKAKLEEQLHQAQKMESVGRLAGGVAHDLNNLLSPIIGYSELLGEEIIKGDDIKEAAREINKAGLRARDVVRQLLAFSRKQVLEMKIIDLNAVLIDFKKLLRRIIRENIIIDLIPCQGLPPIRGDVGQLEQIIMNIAVNAQDAMPEGGVLRIETAVTDQPAADLNRTGLDTRDTAMPGKYVLISFSDTGLGIDKNTQDHLFEPFFTTKEKGKGTGLGLATVYGIVRQHGGSIRVDSKQGKGTTFEIYFPVDGDSIGIDKAEPQSTPKNLDGTETILLVEDNDGVRCMTEGMLKLKGYKVLSAENGDAALSALRQHNGPLNLLLTDVVMPGMSGKELFDRITANRPDVKVLYMSGYTDDVIAHHGVLDENVSFLQKPFSVEGLTQKVREVISGI